MNQDLFLILYHFQVPFTSKNLTLYHFFIYGTVSKQLQTLHSTVLHYTTFLRNSWWYCARNSCIYMHFLVFKNISITKKACLASCACQGAKLAIFKFFSILKFFFQKFKNFQKKIFFHFFSKLHLPNYLVWIFSLVLNSVK